MNLKSTKNQLKISQKNSTDFFTDFLKSVKKFKKSVN